MTRTRLVHIKISPELGTVRLGRTTTEGQTVVFTEDHPFLALVTLPPPETGEYVLEVKAGAASFYWDRDPE
jgi:hypothetical protein